MAHFLLEELISRRRLSTRLLCLFAISSLLLIAFDFQSALAASVADYEADLVSTYFSPYKASRQSLGKYSGLMKEINERNAAVEDSQEWIGEAYKGLMIRKLNDIPPEEYAQYKKYTGKYGRIYVVVHPAYYTFFGAEDMNLHPLIGELNELEKLAAEGDGYSERNLVERLYDMMALDNTLYVMQEQERLTRDFIEVYSTKGALMLLVLPRDYQKRLYNYKDGYDEFARYINEITNESVSVIYMDSATVDRGEITRDDRKMLLDFLDKAGVQTIALGGGYVGRCLDGFYATMIESFGYDNIYMVPEIVSVSPSDIRGKWGANLIRRSGKLNFKQLRKNLMTYGAYEKMRTIPLIKRFYMYRFLKAKLAREEGEEANDD